MSNRIMQLRDFDKLIVVLSNYATDSAVEVRNNSKKSLFTLFSNVPIKSDLDKLF